MQSECHLVEFLKRHYGSGVAQFNGIIRAQVTGLSEACGKGESRYGKNGSQCFHLQFLMGLAFDTA
jgi:hypothetical protein